MSPLLLFLLCLYIVDIDMVASIGRHYIGIHEKMTWSDAESYCSTAFGNELATIANENDAVNLNNLTKRSSLQTVWIGRECTVYNCTSQSFSINDCEEKQFFVCDAQSSTTTSTIPASIDFDLVESSDYNQRMIFLWIALGIVFIFILLFCAFLRCIKVKDGDLYNRISSSEYQAPKVMMTQMKSGAEVNQTNVNISDHVNMDFLLMK